MYSDAYVLMILADHCGHAATYCSTNSKFFLAAIELLGWYNFL
jgi:hypothetical protein